MRAWICSFVLSACSASAFTQSWGIPPGAKTPIVVRGLTFEPEDPKFVQGGETATFESCVISSYIGFPKLEARGGKAVFRGCMIRSAPGCLSFAASDGGSIAFEECLFAGYGHFSATTFGSKASSIRFLRCRFEALKFKKAGEVCKIGVQGGGVTFSACDLEAVQAFEADGAPFASRKGNAPSVGKDEKKNGKLKPSDADFLIDARNCWWGPAPVAEIAKRIKDSGSGHATFMGPSNARVLFVPMSKGPNTTKLKPPEPKAEPPEKKSGDGKKKPP